MADPFAQLPVKGLIAHNSAAPSTKQLPVLTALANAAAPTFTEGFQTLLSLDLAGNLRVTGAGGQKTMANSMPVVIASDQSDVGVNIDKYGGTATTLGQKAMTASIPVAIASDQGNVPVNNAQVNGITVMTGNGITGTGSQRVTIASDNTPFTVKVSKDASANAVADPIWVELSDGTTQLGTPSNPLSVSMESTAGTLVDTGALASSGNIAAGGSTTTTDLISSDITTAKTGKLIEVTFAASVRAKWEVGTWDSGGSTFTSKRTFFTEAGQGKEYKPADADEITFAGGTNKKFRIKGTNLDDANAATFYGSISHVEV